MNEFSDVDPRTKQEGTAQKGRALKENAERNSKRGLTLLRKISDYQQGTPLGRKSWRVRM